MAEESPSSVRPLADELLEELVPEELDWRTLVTEYPKTALAVAALSGFALGRSRGAAIVSALSAFAADTVTRSINELLGEDVL